MVYKKIEPNIWKPENKGDSIEGVLLEKTPSARYPETNSYSLKTDKGDNVIFFGTSVLDSRMSHVKVGEKVKIVYNGTEPNKNKQLVKLFDVFVDDGTIETVKV